MKKLTTAAVLTLATMSAISLAQGNDPENKKYKPTNNVRYTPTKAPAPAQASKFGGSMTGRPSMGIGSPAAGSMTYGKPGAGSMSYGSVSGGSLNYGSTNSGATFSTLNTTPINGEETTNTRTTVTRRRATRRN